MEVVKGCISAIITKYRYRLLQVSPGTAIETVVFKFNAASLQYTISKMGNGDFLSDDDVDDDDNNNDNRTTTTIYIFFWWEGGIAVFYCY